jgi:hypothetical protein
MDIIGIAALVVGAVALGVPFTIEAVKRPRLRITPSEWRNPAFVPWTFATVRVRNEPVTMPLIRSVLPRESAQGCKAEIDYFLWDSTAPFLRLPGRWSSVPEPLSRVPSPLATAPAQPGGETVGIIGLPASGVGPPVSGGTAPTSLPFDPAPGGAAALPLIPRSSGTTRARSEYTVVYDPARDPGSRDVAVSSEGEEIAVAIFRDNEAFAFSTESYRHPSWGNPAWRLNLGSTYRIVVRVRGSGVQQERAFKLAYLTNNPSEFRLQEIK